MRSEKFVKVVAWVFSTLIIIFFYILKQSEQLLKQQNELVI